MRRQLLVIGSMLCVLGSGCTGDESKGMEHPGQGDASHSESPPDMVSPTVHLFSAARDGDVVQISWEVTDTGGSHLARIGVRRAPDANGSPGAWGELANLEPSLINDHTDSHSATKIDHPDSGTWWYGLHVVDQAGNDAREPEPRGPIKVTIPPELRVVETLSHASVDRDRSRKDSFKIHEETEASHVDISHNLWFEPHRDPNDFAVVVSKSSRHPTRDIHLYSERGANPIPDSWFAAVIQDPLFRNGPHNDMSLQAGSPARSGGRDMGDLDIPPMNIDPWIGGLQVFNPKWVIDPGSTDWGNSQRPPRVVLIENANHSRGAYAWSQD